MTGEEWLKRLPPGTMLYRRDIDDGAYLVYHTEVDEFPTSGREPWFQLRIWVVNSRLCKLQELNVESTSFLRAWTIVDGN